jgi:hypothetical protein
MYSSKNNFAFKDEYLKVCKQQLTLTSSTSGSRSVGRVRSRTQAMEFSFSCIYNRNLSKSVFDVKKILSCVDNSWLLPYSCYVLCRSKYSAYVCLILYIHNSFNAFDSQCFRFTQPNEESKFKSSISLPQFRDRRILNSEELRIQQKRFRVCAQ